MNELNRAELRRLAEAAAHKDWYAGNAYGKPLILNSQIITDTPDGKYVLLDGNHHFRADCVANVAFVGAANPAAVLSLLDECDRLQVTCEGLDRQNDAIAEEIGKVAAERDAALAELQEFKNGNTMALLRAGLASACDKRDAALAELEAYKRQLRAFIHISDATGWERHSCGEIAKARKLLEQSK